MKGRKIIAVPATEKGRGGGHLCRCITLVKDLRAAGREAFLYLPEKSENIEKLIQGSGELGVGSGECLLTADIDRLTDIELIILDRFQTSGEELSRWQKLAPVVGIDEGGAFRDSFDFLIDILVPKKIVKPHANIYSPSLIIPKKGSHEGAKNTKDTKGKFMVLVSFGQEDIAGLGLKTAKALAKINNKENLNITLMKGILSKEKIENLPNIRVIDYIPNLSEHLHEYDLVITHYGITAYEALFAKTLVLLASPTKYHAKLTKSAGFPSLSYYLRVLRDLRVRSSLKIHCQKLAAKFGIDKNEDLATLIASFSPQINRTCPVCGADAPNNSTARFSDRTYRRCKKCGVIFMDRTSPPSIEYNQEYFNESYKKQYGKTYLEDFDKIKTEGKRRLKIINSLLPVSSEHTLLDIGCAYGPFLAAAKDAGFAPTGIDPSEDAVRYVQQTLGINAVQSTFPTPHSPLPTPYSVISLWYVIEHFPNTAPALSQIKTLLKPGGILAFSTPSFAGVSGRTSLRRFLSANPADHYTIWSPASCKKALSLAGFKVKKTVSTGHHPERFPILGKLAKNKKYVLYYPILLISKIFRLGDTLEVYAKHE